MSRVSPDSCALDLSLSGRALRALVWTLIAVELALVALDTTINWLEWIPLEPIQRLFNVAREDSLSNWFSSVQTFAVGLVLWLVCLQARQNGRRVFAWALAAAFFTYLGIDDGAGIHERIGSALEDLAAGEAGWKVPGLGPLLAAFPSYTWQLAFAPLLGAGGLLTLWLALYEVRSPRARALVLAGLACNVLAIGLDFVEGMEGAYDTIGAALGLEAEVVSHYSKVCEEFLEMLASTLLLGGFLAHLAAVAPEVRVRFPRA